MPKNNHCTVKMSRATENNPVSVWAVLSGVLIAALASGAAMISGGLNSGAVGLFVVGPVVVWLVWGARAVASAVLSAMLGAASLALLQATSLLPPPVLSLATGLGWVSASVLGLCGLWVLARLLRPGAEPVEAERERDETAPPTELPVDGPLLLVEISALGRIRSLGGATELFDDLRTGQIADQVLLDRSGTGLTAGHRVIKNNQPVLVIEVEIETGAGTGRNLIIVRTDGAAQNSEMQIQQQLRERTDFFAGLGHDLKSPLNAVIGFAEMMETEIRGPMPEPYKDYPGLIRESGQTLLRLVEDMLGYARSEAGTYEIDPSPIDITASAEAVMRQSRPVADRAEVRLELKATGEVLAQADAGAVQRIWDNLVSNAIKYSKPQGLVTLAATQQGASVMISVTDRGAGMDADDLARIARPFEQGRNARGRAGTGLGLAMVRRLAQMHGGKMVVRTAPGEGTQVTVTLPGALEHERRAAE